MPARPAIPPGLRFGSPGGTLPVVVRTRLFRLAAVLNGAWVLSCGPSFEAMHESNLRFEHCYRLDMDPKIASSHREHCWRDWTETYAHEQPLDRIEYARRRISELESGDANLVSLGPAASTESRVFEEAPPASARAPMAGPAPTSAHEPPPRTAPAVPPAPGPSASHPGTACSGQCEQTYVDCGRLCEAKQADCARCNEDYRGCMRRCFQ